MLVLYSYLLSTLALPLTEGALVGAFVPIDGALQVVRGAIKEAWVVHLILFLDLHVHQDFYARFDIVNESETIDFSQLALFFLEQLFVVAVNLFIRSDLYREVKLQKSLF